jgi:uncharacterized protein YbjT (DUF2867 family)
VNLIVGATGMLGGEICRLLSEERQPVRALVRRTSSPDKVARLRQAGGELVTGDLKDGSSLDAACHGATVVVSTASSTLSRNEGDSIESVDLRGQLDLIDAAASAGVRHFVLVSFPETGVDFPLQQAKRAVEARLRGSRMTHTILQPTAFMEVWLGPALGFDVANGRAQIYGGGHNKTSWISCADVARFAVTAVDPQRAPGATVKLGGPDALSPLEVVALAEQLTGRKMEVQHVPEDGLRAQHAAATDSMQKSFAGLMLYYARGDVIDMSEAVKMLPVPLLTSVRDYLQASFRGPAAA